MALTTKEEIAYWISLLLKPQPVQFVNEVSTMRIPCKVQISDLQPTESFVEEELTLEEAQKVIGGISNNSYIEKDFFFLLYSFALLPDGPPGPPEHGPKGGIWEV